MLTMHRTLIGMAFIGALAAAGSGAEARLGTHAVRGRVRSVTTTALVIRRSPKEAPDMRFVLNAATEREGPIVVGDPVSIRYITHGDEMIATAVASESRGCITHGR